MMDLKLINEKIFNKLNTKVQVNLFICHSNLHAFQALTLQCKEHNIALCSENVSISFMRKYFQGEIITILDDVHFRWHQQYSITIFRQKKWLNLSIYLGNKHNSWSSYILNNFPPQIMNILDDGLSSYNISEEIYWEKNFFKRLSKKIFYWITKRVGIYYFHESNNSHIDRKCLAYYFFPDHTLQNFKVVKKKLDVEKFKYYLHLCMVPQSQKVFIASFNESKQLITNNSLDENVRYILHPRVSGVVPDVPNEILSFFSEEVVIGPSSLILYLLFVDYSGKFDFNEDDRANKIYRFFTSTPTLFS